jgi:acetyl esterase/lipase
MAAVLRVMISSDPKPFYELPPKLARRHPTPADAVKLLLKERGESTDPEEVGGVDDRTFDGPDGDVQIRVYTPKSAAADTLLPVVLYIHGGGWVIADLDTYDSSARAICNKAHCLVVSTHYRQAPEHKFPAAHEDTYAAYRWLLEHARSLGGDPSRVAIVGESAGGNMAAAVCYNAKHEGLPLPLHQVLVYPIAGSDTNTESYREMTEAQPLNKPAMEWFFEQYLRTPADGETPAISLDRADLAGLPPATIINAELDPLRTEGELLARRFRESGVEVQQRTFAGVTHEFFGMTPVLAKAREAQQMAADALTRAFGAR